MAHDRSRFNDTVLCDQSRWIELVVQSHRPASWRDDRPVVSSKFGSGSVRSCQISDSGAVRTELREHYRPVGRMFSSVRGDLTRIIYSTAHNHRITYTVGTVVWFSRTRRSFRSGASPTPAGMRGSSPNPRLHKTFLPCTGCCLSSRLLLPTRSIQFEGNKVSI